MDKDTNTELELVESMSLLEWLANNYKNFGAALEIVTDKSQEGAQFVRGFGGIGGELIGYAFWVNKILALAQRSKIFWVFDSIKDRLAASGIIWFRLGILRYRVDFQAQELAEELNGIDLDDY